MHAKQIPTIEFNTAAPSPTEQSQRAIVSQDILWIKPYCGLMQAVAIDRQAVTGIGNKRAQSRVPATSRRIGQKPSWRSRRARSAATGAEIILEAVYKDLDHVR
jgi:hypothetical protein